MNILEQFKRDGYLQLSNLLSDEKLNTYKTFANSNNTIDYFKVKGFIDDIFLPIIQTNVSFMNKPIYTKFRYSNNNNSTDASTFHSDVYNYTNSEIIPIYTCLCYFDSAQIEIIPGSHNKNAGWCYNKKKVISFNPGDMLIFNANLYHRGINYGGTNRRLLQVFEVFPNQQVYDENSSKLIIVQTSASVLVSYIINPFLYRFSKHKWFIDILNYIQYNLVYNDLQYKLSMMDLQILWISSQNQPNDLQPPQNSHEDEKFWDNTNHLQSIPNHPEKVWR
jgi:hypothetical protein